MASIISQEIGRRLIDDLGNLVEAGGDHQDVDTAETIDGRFDDGIAVRFRARTLGDELNLAVKRGAGFCDFFQFGGISR